MIDKDLDSSLSFASGLLITTDTGLPIMCSRSRTGCKSTPHMFFNSVRVIACVPDTRLGRQSEQSNTKSETQEVIHQSIKAEQFRALHTPGKPLILFNIWDAGGVKAVAACGFKAIATGSWSVANANGFRDGEHIPLSLAIENLRRIVGATELPVTIDLESGYGDTPEAVAETIASAIDAGAVGCNLEDSYPANGSLRDTAAQCERLRRARKSADAANVRFFINARTDVFFQQGAVEHRESMLEEAVARAHAYAEAGADGIFTPGLADLNLIARLAKASPLPLNIMVGDQTPPLRALAEQGVARVSYGPRPYLLAMKALQDAARGACGNG
jgi:methylisocitrate lyase